MKSAYEKYLTAWIYTMSLGLLFGVSSLYISVWFMIPFWVVVFSGRYFFIRIRCPNCGTPVIYDASIANFQIFSLFFKPVCKKCGWNLRE